MPASTQIAGDQIKGFRTFRRKEHGIVMQATSLGQNIKDQHMSNVTP
jgi:hypothetical protein